MEMSLCRNFGNSDIESIRNKTVIVFERDESREVKWKAGRLSEVAVSALSQILKEVGEVESGECPRINVVVNWFEELRGRVPVP